jgi:hypothetical protein
MNVLTHSDALYAIESEAQAAGATYWDFVSMHEALGVLFEEFEEFKAAVMLKQSDPSRAERIRREAIQVGATALRIAEQAYRVTR